MASAAFPQPQLSQPQLGSPYPQTPSGIELDRDSDFLIQSFLPFPEPALSPGQQPPGYTGYAAPPGLPQPFCTPQIAPTFDAPFARGYNHALQQSVGLPQDELLSFLDGLNIAMTASPPLRVVNYAGMIIGFIPYHWAMIAGTVMQTAAQTGMHILSKSLTDRYLRAANRKVFHPRGLSVRLCTTAAMQQLVMHSGTGAGPSTLDKIGRGVGTVLLHAPIPFTSRIVRAIADKPTKIPPSISAVGDGVYMPAATQRRLAALAGHALPLDLNVPPPAKAQGAIDTMNSWGVKFDQWNTGRKENKVEQRRRELARVDDQLHRLGIDPQGQRRMQPTGAPISDAELYVMGRRERKDLRRAARRAHKRERGPGLIGSLIGPKEGRLERQVANADLLEHWASDKVLWVVIMNADKDKEIEGIEQADSLENEEHIDQKTWTEAIVKERDMLEEEDSESSDDEKP